MRTSRGFTLIELMVSIAVLAILLGIAAPSFRSMTATSDLRGVSNELITTLAQARSEAIKRGGRVTVCMSADGAACIATGGWEQGWIMFNDDTHSGTTAVIDTGETVLRVFPSTSSNIVINGNMTYVSYSADGLSRLMNGGFLAGTLQVCSKVTGISDNERARKLVINNVGRVLVSKPSVAASCPAPA
jgi:type IV fimbrial biogenesis protein FimT